MTFWFKFRQNITDTLFFNLLFKFIVVIAFLAYLITGIFTQLFYMGLSLKTDSIMNGDFWIYMHSYHATIQGGNPYQERTIGGAFIYPPTALLLVGLLAQLERTGWLDGIYLTCNIILLGFNVWLIGRKYSCTLRQTWWWYFLAFGFAPFYELLQQGQINIIVMLGITLMFYFEDSVPSLAGIAIGTAIAIKVSPITVLGYLVIRGKWRVIGWTAGFSLAAFVAAGLIFGWQHLITYLDVFSGLMKYFPNSNAVENPKALATVLCNNQLVGCHSMPQVQQWLTVWMLSIFVSSAVITYVLKQREPLFIIVILGTTVLPNIVWYHHFVFLLMPIFVWIAWSRFQPGVVGWCFLGLLVIQLDRFLLTKGLLIQVFVHSSILLILGWQIVQLWESRNSLRNKPYLAGFINKQSSK